MRLEDGISRSGGSRLLAPAGLGLAAALLAVSLLAGGALAGVRGVAEGIEFSHYAPGAGKVFLAGNFNGWNAGEIALTDDGKGKWTVVRKLPAGKHEYKFVVDGGWFADPDNPDTAADPYGGMNSLVVVGADGKIAAAAATVERPISNTPLNAKVYVGGRYLVRQRFLRDLDGDPRFRLQRPEQKVDLNFHTEVSDLVRSYTRLRLDNDENEVQNDIAAFLDEASLDVHPAGFHLLGYWNLEALGLGDPLTLGGDLDLSGTILDDHLPAGKGTAGAVVDADPAGFHFQGFFANVHDADFDNDPALFDNTGEDRIGLRLSRKVGGFTLGLPAYLRRQLIWADFGTIVGQPETGIPHLDDYLDRSSDPSTWFETEERLYNYGLDASLGLDRLLLEAEWLYGDARVGLVTGSDSGPNLENGRIDVPLLTRSLRTWHGAAHVGLGAPWRLDLEHTRRNESGAQPDETSLPLLFLPETEADRRVYFLIAGSPPPARSDYSEATLEWKGDGKRHLLWLQRVDERLDHGLVAALSPDSSAVSGAEVWVVSGLHEAGLVERGFGSWSLEYALTWGDYEGVDFEYRSYEVILRRERRLTGPLSVLADVRWILYDVADRTAAAPVDVDDDFWAPYIGLRYRPLPRVEVVAAYGVDPLRFDIDYEGRHVGRWWFRQQYLFDHAGANPLDAERALEDQRVFGLRAQFIF